MKKKAAAVLAVLALTLCFGRVSAWAAPAGDPHACCRGAEAPAPVETTLSECCSVPAAVGSVVLVRADVLVFALAQPVFPAPAPAFVVLDQRPAPPGPQTHRAANPARGPPLA